jgi:hypothetical protein
VAERRGGKVKERKGSEEEESERKSRRGRVGEERLRRVRGEGTKDD